MSDVTDLKLRLHVDLIPVTAERGEGLNCLVCGRHKCDVEIPLPQVKGYERSAAAGLHARECAGKLGVVVSNVYGKEVGYAPNDGSWHVLGTDCKCPTCESARERHGGTSA